jgi:NAD(P)-dependent dehydrogenase (short-subunit alcohol dehydrogenase family)
MDDLRGKVAVITGGASGIGLATAKRLAREGMRLVLADIEQPALDRALEEVRALGAEALGALTDVGDREQVERLAEKTFESFGTSHLLFNNAGVAIAGGAETMRHEDWEWVIRVNLWGVIHGVESFVPRMVQQGEGGHIVNTSSFAGLVPNQGAIIYCTTKYAVVGLSEVLHRDLSQYGIGVSVFCPMLVDTNIFSSARNRSPELGGGQAVPDATKEKVSERPLVGGTITSEEAAEQVLEGIRKRKLYIFTHEATRQYVQRRFARIDRCFES